LICKCSASSAIQTQELFAVMASSEAMDTNKYCGGYVLRIPREHTSVR
jgi:hypothetical protein